MTFQQVELLGEIDSSFRCVAKELVFHHSIIFQFVEPLLARVSMSIRRELCGLRVADSSHGGVAFLEGVHTVAIGQREGAKDDTTEVRVGEESCDRHLCKSFSS